MAIRERYERAEGLAKTERARTRAEKDTDPRPKPRELTSQKWDDMLKIKNCPILATHNYHNFHKSITKSRLLPSQNYGIVMLPHESECAALEPNAPRN